jgi:hypothetical protein
MTRRVHALAFVLPLALATAPAARAEGGMWLPRQMPLLADELRAAGLQVDPAKLSDLLSHPMNAIVSLGGCSASFVSPDGLAVTNHHCVVSHLQYNSTPERNLLTDGFLAATQGEEILASPGARVFVTTAVRDVTGEVLAGLDGVGDRQRHDLVERREKELIAACEEPGGVRCKVVSYFAGLEYELQTQMEIRDVRLVYAPAAGVGNFGGEVDNWMWPRHTGDFGFLRAYVGPDGKGADPSPGNVPYRPRHYLRLAEEDLDPGDLVLVVGYPGRTFRHQTAAETRADQELRMPAGIRHRESLLAILEQAGAGDRAVAIKNASRIRGLANYLKKYRGTLEGFQRGGLLAAREVEERRVRAALAGDAAASASFEAALAELDRHLQRDLATRERDELLEWLLVSSPLLSEATRLHRLALERGEPDAEREPGFQERDLPLFEGRLRRAQAVLEPASDRAGLRHFLLLAAALPAGQRIAPLDAQLRATGAATPEAQVDALLDRLYAGTRLGDLETRLVMFREPLDALLARHDPMIQLAAALWPLHEAVEAREKETWGAHSRLRPEYMRGLLRLHGGKLAPDANGTLRISIGQVEGYVPRDGMRYTPQTTIAGVVEKHTGEQPFVAPARLLAAARGGEHGPYADPNLGTLPVDFLSTAVVTNGSSGSATLDAHGRLCGLAFDGNYEAMGTDYVVMPELTRTIHVDFRYMLWVMDRVDGAGRLLVEMGVEPAFAEEVAAGAP